MRPRLLAHSSEPGVAAAAGEACLDLRWVPAAGHVQRAHTSSERSLPRGGAASGRLCTGSWRQPRACGTSTPLAGSTDLGQLLRQLRGKRDLQGALKAARQEEASAQGTVLLAELKARRRVLLRLGCAARHAACPVQLTGCDVLKARRQCAAPCKSAAAWVAPPGRKFAPQLPWQLHKPACSSGL